MDGECVKQIEKGELLWTEKVWGGIGRRGPEGEDAGQTNRERDGLGRFSRIRYVAGRGHRQAQTNRKTGRENKIRRN